MMKNSECRSLAGGCRRLEGKVAIITGSSLGIGFAIAERLGHEGAHVVVSSRRQVNVDRAVEDLKGKGISVLGMTCHVANKEDRKRLIEQTISTFGGIDILILNAAVNPLHGPIFETSEEIWDKIFDVNVKSAFFMCKEVAPFMEKRGGGSIVFVSSVAGYILNKTVAVYGVTKTTLFGLVKALVPQCTTMNIRVNCIAPGYIKTRFSERIAKEMDEGMHADLTSAMQRPGTPAECSGVVAFLVSDDASFITGETIPITGGMTSHL